MSGGFVLAAEKKSAEPKCEFVGRELSRACKALDRLAARLNVQSLSSFVSLDAGDQELLREMAEEAGADTSAWQMEPLRFFPPAEGLQTVRALLKHLVDNPATIQKSEAILAELTTLEAALVWIEKKKAGFRFFIDC